MLFEIKRIPFHSLKEFCKEFLMIVLGICTALGLENMVTTRHHTRAAEESRQQIVAELQSNLAEVTDSLHENENEKRAKALSELADLLKGDILANVPKAESNRHMQAFMSQKAVAIGINWPTLRHEAWDVVVANQTAIYMDPDALRRYSTSYAQQRDALISIQGVTSGWGEQIIKALVDLDLQRADPMELLYAVKTYRSGNVEMLGTLKALKLQLEASVKGEAKAMR